MGGYILDGGPPYPICAEGDYSCLWYQFCEHNLRCDALEVRAVALHQVLQGYSLPQVLLRHVLAFLYDEDGVFPDLPFTMIFFLMAVHIRDSIHCHIMRYVSKQKSFILLLTIRQQSTNGPHVQSLVGGRRNKRWWTRIQNLTLGVLHPDPLSSATSLSYVRKLSVHSTWFNDRTRTSRWRVLSKYFCMMIVRSAAVISHDHDTLSFDQYRCDSVQPWSLTRRMGA